MECTERYLTTELNVIQLILEAPKFVTTTFSILDQLIDGC